MSFGTPREGSDLEFKPLNEFSIEQLQSINQIFNVFSTFPSVESREYFQDDIRLNRERILRVKEMVEADPGSYDILDQGYYLACHYVYADSHWFKFYDLTTDEQQFFVEMCATLSRDERKVIEDETRRLVHAKIKEGKDGTEEIKNRTEEIKNRIEKYG